MGSVILIENMMFRFEGLMHAIIILSICITLEAFTPLMERQNSMAMTSLQMSTTTAPPPEKTRTDRRTGRKYDEGYGDDDEDDNDDIVKYNGKPMEYLEDEW